MNQLPEKYVVDLKGLPWSVRKIFMDWYNTKYKTSFNSYSHLYLVPYDKKGSTGRRAMKIAYINPNIPIITFEQWFKLKDCTIERYEIF